MRLSRLFLSIYIGLICNLVFFFVFGAAGLKEYHQLEQHRVTLSKNVQELESINWRLTRELRHLAADPAKIEVLARELGYFRSDERIIQPEGFPANKSFFAVGKLISLRPYTAENFLFFRIICIVFSVLIYIASGFFVPNSHHADKEIRS